MIFPKPVFLRAHAERPLAWVVLAAAFLPGIGGVRFFADESQWIASSACFEAFAGGDFSAETWKESLWTLTQPPVTRYVIGLGRTAGGYGPKDLNPPWRFRFSREANEAEGRVPSPRLLWWSRLPMALLAVLSGAIFFEMARAAAGRLAAFLFLAAYAGNPFFLQNLRRAMGESPLLFFAALGAMAAWRGVASLRWPADSPVEPAAAWLRGLCWFAAAGAGAGLAAGAKLNGASTLLTAAALPWLGLLPAGAGGRPSRRILRAGLGTAAAAVSAAVFFVGVNPFLYPAPVARSDRMLRHRVQDMAEQRVKFADQQIAGAGQRLRTIPQRVLRDHAFLRFRGASGLNWILAAAGVAFLSAVFWKGNRGGGDSAAAAVLLVFSLSACAPALLTPLDWDRYFLFPVLCSTLFVSTGVAGIVRDVRRRGGMADGRC